jgi:hypothetical protein
MSDLKVRPPVPKHGFPSQEHEQIAHQHKTRILDHKLAHTTNRIVPKQIRIHVVTRHSVALGIRR